MTQLSRFTLLLVLSLPSLLTAQALPAQTPPDVSGNWQVSWTGRLGTEHGLLTLHQEDGKLSGTFKDVHGLSSLSGTVGEKAISFDVRFGAARPYTIRFTGTLEGGNIQGVSQAVGIGGSTGAYLGHGGEVTQPQHPWTAKRDAQ